MADRLYCLRHYTIVCGNDHIGHGASVSRPADLGFFAAHDGWKYLIADVLHLHELMSKRYPDLPYFLIGHSMGSLIARLCLPACGRELAGAVLIGTAGPNAAAVSAAHLADSVARTRGVTFRSGLLNSMTFKGYNRKIQHPNSVFDWLSRDEAAVDLYNEDPLCGFVPTAGLLHDMMNGIAFVTQPKNIARMKKDLPILFVSGDCDPVGEQGRGVIRAYKCFLKAGMKDVTMKLYHGGRHEMLNETNRAEVYEDVLSWLNSKTGK